MDDLTDRQRQILDLERRRWLYTGAKDEAIREALGVSAHVYYLELSYLIDLPAALRADPVLVGRLRRLRETRQARRRRPAGSAAERA